MNDAVGNAGFGPMLSLGMSGPAGGGWGGPMISAVNGTAASSPVAAGGQATVSVSNQTAGASGGASGGQ